jgi:rod shape-determining protein MreD
MLYSYFFLIGVVFITLQTTFFLFLPGWIGKPDFLFVLIVFLALRGDLVKGAVIVFFFGMLMDIFSGIFLGLYPVAYLFIFFILQGASRHLILDEVIHQVPLVLISYLLMTSCIFIFMTLFLNEASMSWSWRDILLQLFLFFLISIPLFYQFERIITYSKSEKKRSSLFANKKINRFN